MKKILVATDFSENSVSAIHLAIKLALKGDYELTFFYACHLMQPTVWHEHTFQAFEKKEFMKIKKRLSRFITKLSNEIHQILHRIKFATANASDSSNAILMYANQYRFDFICISTNGAGRFRRILGSVVAQLIKKSDIPLIIVPAKHTTAELNSLLWASDFTQLEDEITPVTEFARSIHAKLEILHLLGPEDFNIDPSLLRQMISKRTNYPVELQLEKLDLSYSILENIHRSVQKISPSLLVMFTDRDKTWLESILFPSLTSEYAFESPTAMVIFRTK